MHPGKHCLGRYEEKADFRTIQRYQLLERKSADFRLRKFRKELVTKVRLEILSIKKCHPKES